MPCKPLLPTGEKQAPRFDPPQYWPVNDPQALQRQLQRAMADIKSDLVGVHQAITEPPQVTRRNATPGVVEAIAGGVVRVAPAAGRTITVLLPAARAANKGKDIAVLVEGAGSVVVRASLGTVNGQALVTLNGFGLRVFKSDGGEGGATGGWWIVGQSSASPGSVAIGAGTNTTNQGTVVFGNANNVTFGMNTAGVVTASVTVASTQGSVRFSAGTTNFFGSNWSFANANNVSWTLNGSTLQASATVASTADSIRFSAGTTNFLGSNFSFADANNVSWTLNGSTLQASATVAQQSQLYSHVGGQSVSATRLAFQDASNVTWSMSTAAGGATVIASVAAGGGGAIAASAGTILGDSTGTRFAFLDARMSWAISGTNSVISVIPVVPGIFRVSAGTLLQSMTGAHTLVLSDANNVSFNLSTVGATLAVTAIAPIRFTGGTTNGTATNWSFADANNVSFQVNGSTISASVASSLTNIKWSAGTSSTNLSAVTFSNTNNMSWGLNGSVMTGQPFMLVSHLGGNSVNATVLGFSNASNVTWSLSTAASGATVIASVAAGGGGGITAVNITAGTTNGNLSNFSFANANNISWTLNGSTISAQPFLLGQANNGGGDTTVNATRFHFIGASGVSVDATTAASAITVRYRLNNDPLVLFPQVPGTSHTDGLLGNATMRFTNANNVSFLMTTAASGVTIAGSVAAAGIRVYANLTTNSVQPGTLGFINTNGVSWSVDTNATNDGVVRIVPGMEVRWQQNEALRAASAVDMTSFHNRVLLFPWQPGMLAVPRLGNSAAATQGPGNWLIGQTGNITATSGASSSSWASTYKLGLYTQNGNTLNLFNSVSFTASASAAGSGQQSNHHGMRWIQFRNSAFSDSTLTTNNQYWIAFMCSTANTCVGSLLHSRQAAGTVGHGFVGVAHGTAPDARQQPFWGVYSATTAAFPASLNSSQIATSANAGGIEPWCALYGLGGFN